MAGVTLTLGDFTFAGHEIPVSIPFGSEQALVVHKLVGGVRVVDAMGRDEAPIEWSGIFTGANASSRARYLKNLTNAGRVLLLSWADLRFNVIVSSFSPVFERTYQVPYRIACTVVSDLALPVTLISSPGIDAALAQDMATVRTTAAAVGDAELSAHASALDSAIKSVSTFAKAASATISAVLVPIAAVQARAQLLMASTSNALANVTTLGGVLPNNPIARQVSALSSQVVAATNLPLLINLKAAAGRMGANLGEINSGRTIAVSGGSLYTVAAKQYGDATAWTGLARANAMTDTQITELRTLVVPPVPDANGGVVNA